MKIKLISIAAFMFVTFVAHKVHAAPFDKSYAILIAISKYQQPRWPALESATKDATAIAAVLKREGFEIIPLYDARATKVNIVSEMQKLAKRLGTRDRVLVYFAGHGYTETFRTIDFGYIVPWDGGDDSASYISMEELRAQSSKMGAAVHQLFIMDSCFGGLLTTRSTEGGGNKPPNYIDEISKRPARQLLTAGGKDQRVVSSGPNGHSVFSGALLEALDQGNADTNFDGYVTFSELVAYLEKRASNAYQTPAPGVLPDHGQGEFFFQIGPVSQGRVSELPTPPNPVMRSDSTVGQMVQQSANPIREVLNQYRAAYENLDVKALLRLFPSFQGASELQKKFDDVQGVAMALGSPAIQLSREVAVATCTYSLTYTSSAKRIEQTKPMRAEFHLRLREGTWVIEQIRFAG
jgi:hypothetical protein